MSGRINPREYDLGELRDAVRETNTRRDPPKSADGSGRSDDRTDVEVEFRENGRKAPPSAVNPSEREARRNHSVIEDPEAYVRSRHRRARSATDASRRDRSRKERDGRPVRTPERSRRPTGSTANRRSEFESNLDLLASNSGNSVSRPYLAELPGTYGAQLAILEWLDRLVSKAGRRGAISALEYYESIEWLSAGSRAKLEAFIDGIGPTRTADEAIGFTDHRESLAYIARISGRSRPSR